MSDHRFPLEALKAEITKSLLAPMWFSELSLPSRPLIRQQPKLPSSERPFVPPLGPLLGEDAPWTPISQNPHPQVDTPRPPLHMPSLLLIGPDHHFPQLQSLQGNFTETSVAS